MAKGENIFKRKDGRWEARYIKGYDTSGKILYGYCYGKTYKEAKEKVGKCKAAVLSGVIPVNFGKDAVFSSYCDQWLRTKKCSWKESTYIKYRSTVERHIQPRLGNLPPQELHSGVIGEFTQALLTEEGLSPQTVKSTLVILQSILKFTAGKHPGSLPMVEIVYPKDHRKEMQVLSREDQAKFVSWLMANLDPCTFGILLALCSGIRIGELCALRWENICLEEHTIRINCTMQRLKDFSPDARSKTKLHITPPKSDTSTRIIPMTDRLTSLCRRMNPHRPNSYILTGTETPMEPRTLQYRLKRYTESCGLKDVHFHMLRHTFATRCVEVGFEIKSLSEILGHSSTKITLDRYVHSSMELKRSNMSKLSSVGF